MAGKDPEDEFEEFYPAVSLSPCIATADVTYLAAVQLQPGR